MDKLTEMEKDWLIRAFMYVTDAHVFGKVKALLPVQHAKMFREYWGLKDAEER